MITVVNNVYLSKVYQTLLLKLGLNKTVIIIILIFI